MDKRLQTIFCFSLIFFASCFGLLGREIDFAVSNYNPAVGERVTFEAFIIGDGIRYEWDFDGDGLYEVSTAEPRIAHLFSEPGSVEVSLQVIDEEGRLLTQRRGLLVGESPLFAVREMTIEASGVVLVRVTVSARVKIRALGLEERIARGWQLEIIDAGNAVTKREGLYLQVLWLNPIEEGETWTILYRLHPSDGVGSLTLTGRISGHSEERVTAFVAGDLTILR